MLDVLKRTALMGVGLAFMTKERLEDVARDVSEKAKLSEEDGRRFLEDLKQKSTEARKGMEARIAETIKSMLRKMEVPSGQMVADLEARVAALEEELARRNVK